MAKNGGCPRLFGDVEGQLKPMCYTEGISYSKPVDDSRRIHFR